MTSTQQLIINFFKRNNPVEQLALQFFNTIYLLATMKSRMKLQKYKLLLEIEKLEKMQHSMYVDPKYQATTNAMNRVY